MNVAYEFFKKDEPSTGNFEDTLIFFVDHYDDFLTMWRVMQVQHQATKEKKKQAHQELSDLRDKIEELKASKHKFTEQEKIEFEERKEYFTNLREENDIIYYEGNPMDFNQVTNILLKYQKFFELIEQLDRKGRTKLATGFRVGSNIGLWPVRKMLTLTINCERGEIKKFLKSTKKYVDNIPLSFEKKILSKMEIDITQHKPKEKEEKDE